MPPRMAADSAGVKRCFSRNTRICSTAYRCSVQGESVPKRIRSGPNVRIIPPNRSHRSGCSGIARAGIVIKIHPFQGVQGLFPHPIPAQMGENDPGIGRRVPQTGRPAGSAVERGLHSYVRARVEHHPEPELARRPDDRDGFGGVHIAALVFGMQLDPAEPELPQPFRAPPPRQGRGDGRCRTNAAPAACPPRPRSR